MNTETLIPVHNEARFAAINDICKSENYLLIVHCKDDSNIHHHRLIPDEQQADLLSKAIATLMLSHTGYEAIFKQAFEYYKSKSQ